MIEFQFCYFSVFYFFFLSFFFRFLFCFVGNAILDQDIIFGILVGSMVKIIKTTYKHKITNLLIWHISLGKSQTVKFTKTKKNKKNSLPKKEINSMKRIIMIYDEAINIAYRICTLTAFKVSVQVKDLPRLKKKKKPTTNVKQVTLKQLSELVLNLFFFLQFCWFMPRKKEATILMTRREVGCTQSFWHLALPKKKRTCNE